MADRSGTAFGDTLRGKDPAIAGLAWAARDLIFDVLPNATEVVWIKDGNATYGTGPNKYKEHCMWVAAHARHATIGFYYGLELPDPDGLLKGVGKRIRHVELRSIEDVRRPGLRVLVVAAIRHRVPPPTNDGPISIRR